MSTCIEKTFRRVLPCCIVECRKQNPGCENCVFKTKDHTLAAREAVLTRGALSPYGLETVRGPLATASEPSN